MAIDLFAADNRLGAERSSSIVDTAPLLACWPELLRDLLSDRPAGKLDHENFTPFVIKVDERIPCAAVIARRKKLRRQVLIRLMEAQLLLAQRAARNRSGSSDINNLSVQFKDRSSAANQPG